MSKTLVLVIDRDDDYGVKAGVMSPVVGFDACLEAANKLAIADPEDSDVNSLFAALKFYRENAGKHADEEYEVALLCGYEKVGAEADKRITDQYERLMETIQHDSLVLVSDGAEDESVYPLLNSRGVKINHVEKVYVKQAPNLEGSFYLLSSMLKEPNKRKRFFAPIGFIIVLISLIYFLTAAIGIYLGQASIVNITTPLVGLITGTIILLYVYEHDIDRELDAIKGWYQGIRSGSLYAAFYFTAVLVICAGVIYTYISYDYIHTNRLLYTAVWSVHSMMWFVILALLIISVGRIFHGYLNDKHVEISNITSGVSFCSIGLIMTGILDLSLNGFGMKDINNIVIYIEIAFGAALIFLPTLVQRNLNGILSKAVSK